MPGSHCSNPGPRAAALSKRDLWGGNCRKEQQTEELSGQTSLLLRPCQGPAVTSGPPPVYLSWMTLPRSQSRIQAPSLKATVRALDSGEPKLPLQPLSLPHLVNLLGSHCRLWAISHPCSPWGDSPCLCTCTHLLKATLKCLPFPKDCSPAAPSE